MFIPVLSLLDSKCTQFVLKRTKKNPEPLENTGVPGFDLLLPLDTLIFIPKHFCLVTTIPLSTKSHFISFRRYYIIFFRTMQVPKCLISPFQTHHSITQTTIKPLKYKAFWPLKSDKNFPKTFFCRPSAVSPVFHIQTARNHPFFVRFRNKSVKRRYLIFPYSFRDTQKNNAIFLP